MTKEPSIHNVVNHVYGNIRLWIEVEYLSIVRTSTPTIVGGRAIFKLTKLRVEEILGGFIIID